MDWDVRVKGQMRLISENLRRFTGQKRNEGLMVTTGIFCIWDIARKSLVCFFKVSFWGSGV